MEINGLPMFPHDSISHNPGGFAECQEGMSLRDWFAGHAISGLLSMPTSAKISVGPNTPNDNDRFADAAYAVADAMLRAREEHAR